ncbi:MAG: hypothetical protein HYW47_06680 [Deltaproteobacteria bacterium]|nr:hypothetical protein [Deltaproteobacteria bacterium]
MEKNKFFYIFSYITTCFFGVTLYATSIQLTERPLPKRYNECQHCHLQKQKRFVPATKKTVREHSDKKLKHGNIEMSCNHCHDIAHRNYLRSTPSHPASFENSSPVCAQCHEDRHKDWKNGIHGHRIGEWNGNQIQFHCIDCHNPHNVSFKKMEARPAPHKPHCCGKTKEK